MTDFTFEWDDAKSLVNLEKHGIDFVEAKQAFFDPFHIIARDNDHSMTEERFYCFGKIENEIVTVRFTKRNQVIRIFGAGCWRKGRKIYEEARNLY